MAGVGGCDYVMYQVPCLKPKMREARNSTFECHQHAPQRLPDRRRRDYTVATGLGPQKLDGQRSLHHERRIIASQITITSARSPPNSVKPNPPLMPLGLQTRAILSHRLGMDLGPSATWPRKTLPPRSTQRSRELHAYPCRKRAHPALAGVGTQHYCRTLRRRFRPKVVSP